MAKYKTHRLGTSKNYRSTFQLIVHFLRDFLCAFVYFCLSKYVLVVNTVLFLILTPYCALLLSFCAFVSCFGFSKRLIENAHTHILKNPIAYTCSHVASFLICLFYLMFSSHTLQNPPRLVSYFLKYFSDVLLTLRLSYNWLPVCALSIRFLPMHVHLRLSSHFLKRDISYEMFSFLSFQFLLLTSCVATLHFVFGIHVGLISCCTLVFIMSYIVPILKTLSPCILPVLKMCLIFLKALTIWFFLANSHLDNT